MLNILRVISVGNMLRRLWRLELGTMTISSRNWVVEVTRRVIISFQLQPLCQLVFHPYWIGMPRRAEQKAINLRELFRAPWHTPLSLSVLRTIRASVSQGKRDVLGLVSLVIGWVIVLLDRNKEVEIVVVSLQLQQQHQVTQLSMVTHLIHAVVSARIGCTQFKLASITKVFLM